MFSQWLTSLLLEPCDWLSRLQCQSRKHHAAHTWGSLLESVWRSIPMCFPSCRRVLIVKGISLVNCGEVAFWFSRNVSISLRLTFSYHSCSEEDMLWREKHHGIHHLQHLHQEMVPKPNTSKQENVSTFTQSLSHQLKFGLLDWITSGGMTWKILIIIILT